MSTRFLCIFGSKCVYLPSTGGKSEQVLEKILLQLNIYARVVSKKSVPVPRRLTYHRVLDIKNPSVATSAKKHP